MANYQLIGPLGPISLDAGCTITVEAIDPDTGAQVTGVEVTQFAVLGSNAAGETVPIEANPLFAYGSSG